jgi:phage terminase large subunit
VLHSRHEDNPTLFDERGEPTVQGERTLEVLDSLTGVRKERLRYGRWVAAEGVVYDGFARGTHVLPRFDIPPTWRRIGAVDFGYTNPSVFQLWAIDPDGRMCLEREVYRTQTLAADLGAEILELTRGLTLEAVVADHDAEDRATLYRAGVKTRAAIKEVGAGIQRVQTRLRLAGDGKPRLFLLEGALVDRDPELAAAHKPCGTLEEFESYVWARSPDGKPIKEEPVKVHDHGMDAMRYAVEYVDRTSAPAPSFEERVRTKVEARGIPVEDLTERHLAFERARAEEKKKADRPRYLPTNISRLRRFR